MDRRRQKLESSNFPSLFQITDQAVNRNAELASADSTSDTVLPDVDSHQNANAHWIGGFGITPYGVYIDISVTEQEWLDFIPAFERLSSVRDWAKADWCCYGHDTLRKSYAEIAARVGMKSEKSAEVYASISRNASELIRINSPSFSHFRKVVSLSEDEQLFWLQKAAAQGWSSQQLGDALKPRKLAAGISRNRQRQYLKEHKKTVKAIVTKTAKMPEQERFEFAQYLRDLAARLEAGDV